MPKVQIDGVGTVELDNSFSTKAPAEQQSIIDEIAGQHASQTSANAQPTMLQTAAASWPGRLVHDLVVKPVESMAIAGASMLENVPGGALIGLPKLPGAGAMASSYFNAVPEAKYDDAVAAQRNRPGYAQARAQADRQLAARGGSGLTDQFTAPLNPAMQGGFGALDGLLSGSLSNALNRSNANADAQTAAQTQYATDNPASSSLANVAGSLMFGGPKIAEGLPAYAGDSAILTRLGKGRTFGPLPQNPATAPLPQLPAGLPQIPAKTQQQATQYVSNLMQASGKTPADLAALPTTKPLMAAEAMGKPGQVGLSALGRRDGATPEALQGALDERSAAAPERVLGDYASASGIDPAAARGDMQELVKNGRIRAKPLYTDALAGGSTAPLEDQLRTALTTATGAKGQIARQMKAIEANNSGALASRGAAGAEIRAKYMDLHQQLQQAEADRLATMDMFQKSAGDAASNAPGAVWSPRLQQFLNDPILKGGLHRGLELERLDSLAEGRQFNPTEYGVTGTDEAGHPIIGNVPNMRVLDAGKKGLDAILREPQHVNPLTKRLNTDDPRVVAIDKVRRAYVSELDNLNPRYRAARAEAGDYLSAQEAFHNGGKMILNGNQPAADFAQHLQRLDPADREAFKGGIANKLFNQAQNGALSLKVLNRPIVQQKLSHALGPREAAAFLDNVRAEANLAQTGSRMRPGNGSHTQELKAAMDEQDGGHPGLEFAVDAGSNIVSHGLVRGALKTAGQYAKNPIANLKAGTMPVPVRDAAGNLLMLPPGELAAYLQKATRANHRPPPLPLPRLGPSSVPLALGVGNLPRQGQ